MRDRCPKGLAAIVQGKSRVLAERDYRGLLRRHDVGVFLGAVPAVATADKASKPAMQALRRNIVERRADMIVAGDARSMPNGVWRFESPRRA